MTKDRVLRNSAWYSWYLLLAVILVLSSLTVFAQGSYKEIEVKNRGTITGVVKFVGALPYLRQFDVRKNPEQCGHKKPFDRLILVNNNGVEDAVVSLEGITEGKRLPTNLKYTINQKNCDYVPHVQVVSLGAQLQIVNSDNIPHNVHAYTVGGQAHTLCNIGQAIKGQYTTLKEGQLGRAGVILTTCDAGHPWMTGNLILSEHPYYAVTDKNGRFIIADVPPGTYKIKMWHEGFKILGTETENDKVKKYNFEDRYETTRDVTVLQKGRTVVNFELASR